MKTALISFFAFIIFAFSANARDFVHVKVFTCGPKILGFGETYKNLGSTRWKYYFVNLGENGDFVVLHDDIQYTNFRDTKLDTIYQQNGGTFRATMKKTDGVLVFSLLNKKSDYVNTFTMDLQSLTYVARVSRGINKYKPSIGVCKLEEK